MQFIAICQLFSDTDEAAINLIHFRERWKLAMNLNGFFIAMDANSTAVPVAKSSFDSRYKCYWPS